VGNVEIDEGKRVYIPGFDSKRRKSRISTISITIFWWAIVLSIEAIFYLLKIAPTLDCDY